MKPIVDIQNVTLAYDKEKVLEEVDLVAMISTSESDAAVETRTSPSSPRPRPRPVADPGFVWAGRGLHTTSANGRRAP